MKIIVYAISKNEEKFVDRWYNSVKDADEIYVLDTGSTDKTVEKLKEKGVIVTEKIIDPWRFDVARNLSLDMVSTDADVCVCIDLDEVIMSGWKEEILNCWNENTTRIKYNYNWSLDKFDKPIVNFRIDKIHSRNDYKWTYPVHEVLENINNNESYVFNDNITVNHYPDATKSRSSYLPLLELSVLEDPNNDRNLHYLGREYMYYKKWNECIDTLIKHLSLPSATWKDERCASMRFIARSYKNLKRYEEANMWLEKAINEAPYLRDPYVEMALLQYELKDYDKVIYYGKKALEITNHPKTYINEVFSFNETIYDLLSFSYYIKNDFSNAYYYGVKGIEINPNNERLKNNVIYFKKNLDI